MKHEFPDKCLSFKILCKKRAQDVVYTHQLSVEAEKKKHKLTLHAKPHKLRHTVSPSDAFTLCTTKPLSHSAVPTDSYR